MEKRDPMATLAEAFTMSGGDGTHSYARNSTLQKSTIDGCKDKTKEAISALVDFQNPYFDLNLFKIADFGCSVGPNTFDVAQYIIDTLKHKFQHGNNAKTPQEDLEFHVFYNDQSKNDFNTLFKNLPSDGKYFVAGVPGSFHGRVFPKNSLHIGHTSNTLHWLSKTPEDTCGLNSKAHKEQFERDNGAFLKARSEELVPGGLMIMLGQCLADGVPFDRTMKGVVLNMFIRCLTDIINSDILTSKEKIDSFNLPMYFPYFSELKELIEQNGCFSVEMMEEVSHTVEVVSSFNDIMVSCCRAVFHEVLVERYGEALVDEVFDRFAKELMKYPIDVKNYEKDTQYLIVLKKKAL